MTKTEGDPDPINAGTAGDAARWGGSSAAVGMAANPLGAHQVGRHRVRPHGRSMYVRSRGLEACRVREMKWKPYPRSRHASRSEGKFANNDRVLSDATTWKSNG